VVLVPPSCQLASIQLIEGASIQGGLASAINLYHLAIRPGAIDRVYVAFYFDAARGDLV
jgi:hypothetical protein